MRSETKHAVRVLSSGVLAALVLDPFSMAQQPGTVKITPIGARTEVLYAGGVSGSVAGLLQVNVRVPANAVAAGSVPFVLIIGSHWTVYQATIALR